MSKLGFHSYRGLLYLPADLRQTRLALFASVSDVKDKNSPLLLPQSQNRDLNLGCLVW